MRSSRQKPIVRRPLAAAPTSQREGRLFGALVLAAFVLYGSASAVADTVAGVALAIVNSIAVTAIGIIGYRQLRHRHDQIGTADLASRIVEAVLLGGGIALFAMADISGFDTTGYLYGMIALGVGSVPFWHVVGRLRLLSSRFEIVR